MTIIQDKSFDVERAFVVSIKNPRSGSICVPAVGEVIRDDTEAKGKIILCEKQSEKEIA